MISAFMLDAVFTAAALGIAAWVAEHALRRFGLPGRWVWVVAVAGAVVLPAIFMAAPQVAANPATLLGGSLSDALWETVNPVAQAGAANWRLEVGLQGMWFVLSGACLVYLALSAARLHVSRRGWRSEVVAGHPVLVSEDVGPAVVGLAAGKIVVPRWALRVEERLQRLMLAHELEHLRARDPLLLVLVATALIAMPWSAPLWWIAHRLRLAVEMDCDARVLRGAPKDVNLYGNLLIEVGRRFAGPAVSSASFSHPRSPLEHRIRAMTSSAASRGRGRVPSAVGAFGIVMASVAFVWSVPHPILGICEEALAVAERPAESDRVVIAVTTGRVRVIRTLPAAGG